MLLEKSHKLHLRSTLFYLHEIQFAIESVPLSNITQCVRRECS
jgi:hypothetical protein